MVNFVSDFIGTNGSKPDGWSIWESGAGVSGSIQDNKLRHLILDTAARGSTVGSDLTAYTFEGGSDWVLNLDYNIINYFLSLDTMEIIRFRVVGSNGKWGGISVNVGYDVNYVPELSILTRDSIRGFGNERTPVAATGVLTIEGSSGNLILSYNSGWGGGSPIVFSDILDSGIIYTLSLSTSIGGTKGEETVDFDSFTLIGDAIPALPSQNLADMNCGISIGMEIKAGPPVELADMNCGISLGAAIEAVATVQPSEISAAISLGAKIEAGMDHAAFIKAGLCLACLMNAAPVPDNVLEMALSLSCSIWAENEQTSIVEAGIAIGCTIEGSGGPKLCAVPEYSDKRRF
jgi:hypothetical protein